MRWLECRNFSPIRPVSDRDVTQSEGLSQRQAFPSLSQLSWQGDVQAGRWLNGGAAGRE